MRKLQKDVVFLLNKTVFVSEPNAEIDFLALFKKEKYYDTLYC